ncbi:MAG: ATP-binding protein [Bacteroidota bacterium]
MTAAVSSNLQEINSILRDHNPFSQPPILRAQHVWGESFPDIESLNAHASDAVFSALDDVRAGCYPTTSIVISAESGTGKTHVISRIRHRLQQQGGALFVFANEFDADDIESSFQQLLSNSLKQIGAKEVRQWQELATEITNSVLKAKNPNTKLFSPKELIARLDKITEQKASRLIQQINKDFCRKNKVQDPDITKAILWNLSINQADYAANWLAGMELAQYKAIELKLPTQRQSFNAIVQILQCISQFNQLIICFDELEDDNCDSSTGLKVAQSVAYFVKKLFEHIHRGVILTTIHPGIWKKSIKDALPKSILDRMTAHGKPYELDYMDSQAVVELVSFSLESFYQTKGIIPPNITYPFEKSTLEELGKERPTARQVLKWCKQNFDSFIPNEDAQEIEADKILAKEMVKVKDAFDLEKDSIMDSFWEQNKQIGNALLFSFQRLTSQSLEGVKVSEVTDRVKVRGGKDPYLNFKIIGKGGESEICIGVAVLQDDGGKSLGAGFKRLLDKRGEFNITRGCLVRSQEKPLNRYFRNNYLEPLIHTQGGEWVDLTSEDIALSSLMRCSSNSA